MASSRCAPTWSGLSSTSISTPPWLSHARGERMDLPPIATTTVGSFPRPSWLAEREGTSVHFRLDGRERQEAQDDATILVLRVQEDLGLDLLTDGEQRRPHFISHVLAGLEGVDVTKRRLKPIYRRQA